MSGKPLNGIGITGLLAGVLVTGCQQLPAVTDVMVLRPYQPSAQLSSSALERGMVEQRWAGRPVDDLIASMGAPDMVIDATPRGVPFDDGVPKVAYLYYKQPSSRSCIDTFVVEEGSGQISRYFCR